VRGGVRREIIVRRGLRGGREVKWVGRSRIWRVSRMYGGGV